MTQYAFESVRQEYADLWAQMTVTKESEAAAQARKIIRNKDRYKAVEATTKVPWGVVGCLHMRESNADFNTWLHNGDPMRRGGVPCQTVQVPRGRPPDPNVSWEEGAYDALIVIEHFDQIKDWGPERVAYAAEKFNGWGYRSPSRNIPSPYLWGGTSVQQPGKFVRDGVYDASVIDPQIGAMAVLKELLALDPQARFKVSTLPKVPPPVPTVPTEKPSPKAEDTESQTKPLPKSKTIWGGLMTWLAGIGSAIGGLFDKLDNPYVLAAFVIVLILASVGLYLVIKGRIDVQKIIKHLSQDDTTEAPQ
jgi:lysozyme family protein